MTSGGAGESSRRIISARRASSVSSAGSEENSGEASVQEAFLTVEIAKKAVVANTSKSRSCAVM